MADLLNGAGHLPEEAAFGYAHGLLTADELRTVDAHLAACEECRRRVAGRLGTAEAAADARAALGLGARRPAAPIRWMAAAAVVIAAAGAAWWARLGAGPSPRPETPAPEDARVRTALRSGRLPLPPFLAELAPARETLMGGADRPDAGRYSPSGTAVLDAMPTFTWPAVPAGRRYRVRIFTLSGEAVAESPAVAGTSWTSPKTIGAGTYQWQVEADRDAGPLTIPAPPERPPRFRVLDAATATRLRSLAKSRPENHLKLAVEYARAGAVEGARAELQAELADHPSRGDVRALLDSLR